MSTVTLKGCVSRLHDILTLRRSKKTKARPVISAPFDFKKEDSSCILPGISGAELYMLREKAAASIAGSAITSTLSFNGSPDAYDAFDAYDTVTLAPSSLYDFHPSRNNSSATVGTVGTLGTTGTAGKPAGGHHHQHHHHRHQLLHPNRSTSSFDRALPPPRPSSACRCKSGHASYYSHHGGTQKAIVHRSMTMPHAHAPPTLTLTLTPTPTPPTTTTIPGPGPESLYTSVTLASTQPYAPTGLSCPSVSSVSSAY